MSNMLDHPISQKKLSDDHNSEHQLVDSPTTSTSLIPKNLSTERISNKERLTIMGFPEPDVLIHWMSMDDCLNAYNEEKQMQELDLMYTKKLFRDEFERSTSCSKIQLRNTYKDLSGTLPEPSLVIFSDEDNQRFCFESSSFRLRGGGKGQGKNSINCSLIMKAPYRPRPNYRPGRIRGGGSGMSDCFADDDDEEEENDCCPPPQPPCTPVIAIPVAMPVPVPIAIPVKPRKKKKCPCPPPPCPPPPCPTPGCPEKSSCPKKSGCQRNQSQQCSQDPAESLKNLCDAVQCILDEVKAASCGGGCPKKKSCGPKSECAPAGDYTSSPEDEYSSEEQAQLATMAALAASEAGSCNQIVRVVDPDNPCKPPLEFQVTKVEDEEESGGCPCGNDAEKQQSSVVIITGSQGIDAGPGTNMCPVPGAPNVFIVKNPCDKPACPRAGKCG